MPAFSPGVSTGGSIVRTYYTREELYVNALEQGEEQFGKFNVLIDIDFLKTCQEKLKQYRDDSFAAKYTEREADFSVKAAIAIVQAEAERVAEKAPVNQLALMPAQAAVDFNLPEDVLKIIFSKLSFVAQTKARNVSKFFKQSVDTMCQIDPILLPYNLLLDLEKLYKIYGKIMQSDTIFKNIRIALDKSKNILRPKNLDKIDFAEIFENELMDRKLVETPALQQCVLYNSDGDNKKKTARKNLINMLSKKNTDPDVYCALIVLELKNKSAKASDIKSYIYELCFYNDCKDAQSLEKTVGHFMEKLAYVGCIKQHRVKELTQQIVKFAVDNNLVIADNKISEENTEVLKM